MSSQSNDLNPKNAIFHAYKKKVGDIISRQASSLYMDKDFADEYKAVYLSSSVLRVVANLLSSATFTIAVYLALNHIIPKGYAFVLALLSSMLFEVLKNKIWAIVVKTTLKYKRVSMLAVSILLGLHLISIGGSIFGAWQITNLLPPAVAAPAPTIDIDSINNSYNEQAEQMNNQIASLETKKDWNSRVSLKEIINQKTTLLQSQKTAILDAKNMNAGIMLEHKKKRQENTEKDTKKKQTIRQASIFATAFFELAFIVCSIFIAYYLFRKHIDDTHAENKEHTEGKEPSVKTASVQGILVPTGEPGAEAGEAPQIENKRVVIKAFQQGATTEPSSSSSNIELGYTRICQLEDCKKPFIHSIHNQKFCTTDCRKLAYLKRKSE